jgi:hypothetical protein
VGVYGWANAYSGPAYGVHGVSDSLAGAGVYARGAELGADLIVAGNAENEDANDGRIHSDPQYPSSDIRLVANDDVMFELNDNNTGEVGVFEIRDGGNHPVFQVNDVGDVLYQGALVGAFPQPAWDSEWRTISQGTCSLLEHQLGGDADDYLVDLQFKDTTGNPPLMGIHNYGYGCDTDGVNYRGAFWRSLTSTSIVVCRCLSDDRVGEVRVRIWVYQ